MTNPEIIPRLATWQSLTAMREPLFAERLAFRAELPSMCLRCIVSYRIGTRVKSGSGSVSPELTMQARVSDCPRASVGVGGASAACGGACVGRFAVRDVK